jgi:hypothetical protein
MCKQAASVPVIFEPPCTYEQWQKSNETVFLLTINFILCTNKGYPLQNSSLGQLHSDGGIVTILRSSAGRLLLEYLSYAHPIFVDKVGYVEETEHINSELY